MVDMPRITEPKAQECFIGFGASPLKLKKHSRHVGEEGFRLMYQPLRMDFAHLQFCTRAARSLSLVFFVSLTSKVWLWQLPPQSLGSNHHQRISSAFTPENFLFELVDCKLAADVFLNLGWIKQLHVPVQSGHMLIVCPLHGGIML